MCEFLLPLIKVQVYLFAFVKGTTHCFNMTALNLL